MKNIIVITVFFIPILLGCDGLIEPLKELYLENESLYSNPRLAQGLLGDVYEENPLRNYPWDDLATDDAVSNDVGNQYKRIAGGNWTADNSPVNSSWQNLFSRLENLNTFIEIVDDVKWAEDERTAALFADRMRGDAYGMRALFFYQLLRRFAGYDGSGNLLGIPLVLSPEKSKTDFNNPRNTFEECITQIIEDMQIAIDNLPDEYRDISNDALVPEKYREKGYDAAEYSRVFGEKSANRMSALIAKAVRAQAVLLAASPAFSAKSGYTYADAATYMADVLSFLGANPVAAMPPTGYMWFNDQDVLNTMQGRINPPEIIWRHTRTENRNYADDNFPPSLWGRGRINPTQNLVDAFPMEDGYPRGDAGGVFTYEDQDPYKNRDKRLAAYIYYHGSNRGGSGDQNINVAVNGGTRDALGSIPDRSTLTGYYMKKLYRTDLRSTIDAPSGVSAINRMQYKAMIRFTEIFLGFAEAANEAWGPTDARTGYSAYDVIKAIRARANQYLRDNGDPYLESIKGDYAAMSDLIRNERRIELCFEGYRFWDLRRWDLPLTEPARGMRIEQIERKDVYTEFTVERRAFENYMRFAPLPYSEVLKFSNLRQNAGW